MQEIVETRDTGHTAFERSTRTLCDSDHGARLFLKKSTVRDQATFAAAAS